MLGWTSVRRGSGSHTARPRELISGATSVSGGAGAVSLVSARRATCGSGEGSAARVGIPRTAGIAAACVRSAHLARGVRVAPSLELPWIPPGQRARPSRRPAGPSRRPVRLSPSAAAESFSRSFLPPEAAAGQTRERLARQGPVRPVLPALRWWPEARRRLVANWLVREIRRCAQQSRPERRHSRSWPGPLRRHAGLALHAATAAEGATEAIQKSAAGWENWLPCCGPPGWAALGGWPVGSRRLAEV
jgi:hypothetical protein